MRLWIVRHAPAVDPTAELPDAARALTPKGRERFATAVRGLRRLNASFDLIVHSPLLRAVQTAELLAPLNKGTMQVAPELALEPSEDLLAVCTGQSVALVGHEPHVSTTVAWLTCGWESLGPTGAVLFKKGAVACLEGELRPGRMQLRGLWQPGVLRKLAR